MDPTTIGPLVTPPANPTPPQGGSAFPSARDLLDKDIFELINATNFSDREKEELTKKMVETIERRVMMRIDGQLSDEEAAKLRQIIEQKNQQAFSDFLKTRNINLAQFYAQESILYKAELAAMISELDRAKQNK